MINYQQVDVETRIKEILSDKLEIAVDKINSDSLLVKDLGMDSFALIEIGYEVEERFKIDNVSDQDLTNVKTVKDLVDHINRHLKNA